MGRITLDLQIVFWESFFERIWGMTGSFMNVVDLFYDLSGSWEDFVQLVFY